ncbi:MAG: Extracellular solute-binding protein family 5 [Thermotoga sp. 50_1627]|uniref:ABC transporter substrate-binding protein n=1 Tax=Pseudothermotoga sp. TaxID=2033661 RepID=UPI00076C5800|nr:MAG: Extracellular solute-binding protein family 5 [Thermotoga sp. 50_64]KUK24490.1 MAG: Extracellular solute-binding protein family 5 [Thermotoga sp. 50_1627]MBC7117069.1 ABC transporter substrate-binding protein [Pseudothermotoga sp.]MDK2923168.1 peptide/nickel transport system substrate-binding protein [Pseudothermotoga sp.]HBT39088.1 ABC transporter substrate-binding protein [Pseudothermotoga sp.]
MRKFLLVLLAALACLVFATEYMVEDELVTPDPSPKSGGTLRLLLASTPESYLLYGTLDSSSYSVIMGPMFSPLVAMHPVTNEIVPALAKSWSTSPDGKEVTFKLREAYWSDGTPITADDVVFTFKYFVMNQYARGNSIARFTIPDEHGVNKMIEWVKIDDKTVKAILPSPYGAFFTVLSHVYIYPKHKLEPLIDKNDLGSVNKVWLSNTDPKEIVVNGPFKPVQLITDQKLVLERNPYFWKVDRFGNRLPYFDRVEYLIIRDAEMRLAKFMAGEIDFMAISSKDFPMLKEQELTGKTPYVVYATQPTQATPSPIHISFNFDVDDPELRDLFRKLEFREAMEYALNRERIIDEVFAGLAIPDAGLILPSNKAFYNPKVEELLRPYDLKKANELLDKIGLTKRDKEGYRLFPSGRRVEFNLLVQNSPKEYQDVALIFAEDLKRIGIKVNLQILDASLVGEMFGAGNFQAGIRAFGNQPDLQLRKAIWQPGTQLYYWHYSTMDKTKTPPQPVFEEMLDWEKRIWELFEKAQIEMDPAKRKAYYDEVQELYHTYLPVIFVCKGMNIWGFNKTLGNAGVTEEGVPIFIVWTSYRK